MMKTQVLCEDGIDAAEAVLAALDAYRGDLRTMLPKRAAAAAYAKSL